jgi:hypothetical protein
LQKEVAVLTTTKVALIGTAALLVGWTAQAESGKSFHTGKLGKERVIEDVATASPAAEAAFGAKVDALLVAPFTPGSTTIENPAKPTYLSVVVTPERKIVTIKERGTHRVQAEWVIERTTTPAAASVVAADVLNRLDVGGKQGQSVEIKDVRR